MTPKELANACQEGDWRTMEFAITDESGIVTQHETVSGLILEMGSATSRDSAFLVMDVIGNNGAYMVYAEEVMWVE